MTAGTSKIRALRQGRKPWPKRRPPIARLRDRDRDRDRDWSKPPQARTRRVKRGPERCQ
jgi:hypothetical protein